MRQTNMMWKRLLAVMLAVCMAGTLIPALSFAAAAEEPVTETPVETADSPAEEAEAAVQEEEIILFATGGNFSIGNTTYDTLEEALEAAVSGNIIVMTATAYTLAESVSIPSGVTLVLPYSDTVSVNSASASQLGR